MPRAIQTVRKSPGGRAPRRRTPQQPEPSSSSSRRGGDIRDSVDDEGGAGDDDDDDGGDSDDEDNSEAMEVDEDEGAGGRRKGKGKKDNDSNKNKNKKPGRSPEELARLERELARYILLNEYRRKTFKLSDVSKTIFAKTDGKTQQEVFKRAQRTLRDVAGLELVPYGKPSDSKGKQTTVAGKPKVWMLRSTLDQAYLDKMATLSLPELAADGGASDSDSDNDDDDDDGDAGGYSKKPKILTDVQEWRKHDQGQMRSIERAAPEGSAPYGLLSLVLSLILVSGKMLPEDLLMKHLGKFGLQEDSVLPPALATVHREQTVQQTLAQYLRNGYLTKRKAGQRQDGTNKDAFEYLIGPRADAEIGDQELANFVVDIQLNTRLPNEPEDDDEGMSSAQIRKLREKRYQAVHSSVLRASGQGTLQSNVEEEEEEAEEEEDR